MTAVFRPARRPSGRGWILLFVFGAFGCDGPRKGAPPEAATGWNRDLDVPPAEAMVVAAHPLASQAGAAMLRDGGSAADASVAVQAMLTLVEPQSSGIGGGAFVLYHTPKGGLQAFDGRETAPKSAGPDLFVGPDGEPMGFFDALVGGRSVGAPGAVAALARAHRQHGRLPWAQLFGPAIRTAERGFEVTPRLAYLLQRDPVLRLMPAARALYYPDGAPLAAGERLRNPELAAVFRRLAELGPKALYEGELAGDIADAVAQATQPSDWTRTWTDAWLSLGFQTDLGLVAEVPAPGLLTRADLEAYRAPTREPICRPYRGHRVCGFPPPTSGGLAVLQALGILEQFDLSAHPIRDPRTVHLIAEASKLAFADRNRWVGDPDFVEVPVEGLLDPGYLAERARTIDSDQAMERPKAGKPPGSTQAFRPGRSPELPSTSHFSIADRFGHLASVTTSIENVFGSRVLVRGFLLNNQLTDFSFAPTRRGRPVANAAAPRKRPRSSMSPTVVYGPDGRARFAVGSPGGSRIIGYVLDTLVALIDHGMSPQEAVALPHVLCRGGPVEVDRRGWESPQARESLVSALSDMGHRVRVGTFTSGLHVLGNTDRGWRAGVDPRREGRAVAGTPQAPPSAAPGGSAVP